MSIFDSFNINASGLTLERLKLDTISTNIANVNTMATENSEAYHKKTVSFAESLKKTTENREELSGTSFGKNKSYGVRVTAITEDDQNVKYIYEPGNPAADENGYIEASNVNMADEMIDLISAQRSYEANATALESSKSMLKKALEISKN